MNVSLTPEVEQFVHDQVQSGRYISAEEAVNKAGVAQGDRSG
jgi:putative addiction module CopG family antidote